MNALGIQLLWAALQVVLVGLACWGLQRVVRSHDGSITLAGLIVACGLLATAWLPLPSWLDHRQHSVASSETNSPPTRATADPVANSPRDAAAPRAANTKPASWLDFMSWELVAAARSSDAAETPHWNWPAVVAMLCLAASGLGLVQLVLGIVAVAEVRRRSTPLSDKNLSELLATICAELDIVRPVNLYESRQLVTAATVGWRRPAILLPPQWQAWSGAQQRAVLAHELAHVQRGDYFTGLLAQLGVALQFYHPVMHWMGHRLRLEQELAADAVAAALLGGEQVYLHSLVELALEQSDRTLGWPARNFLPTRGTFMRRIEMLRSSSGLVPRRMSVSRIAACGALLLIGIMASGLRSPFAGNGQNLAAQEEGASASTLREQPKDFDLNLIPNDTAAIVSWRPSQVVVSPALAPAVSDMVKRLETDTGLNLTHVTQMTWIAHRDAERGGRGTLGLLSKPGIACILQSSDPKKLNDFIARVLPAAQAIQIGPFTIHRSDNESQPYAYYRPDEHTVVFDHIDTIARFLVGERGTPKLTSSSLWQAIAADPIVAIADVAWLSERLSLQPGEAPPAAAGPLAMQLVPFAPLYRDTQVAAASLSLNEATQLKLLATSTSEERAIRVQRTADAGLVLLGNYLEQAHHQTSKLPAEQLVVAHSVLSLAQRALASAKVQREGATVELTSSLPLEQAILLGLIAPALEAQRTAAQQASAMNNLKQIGIALHKYADAHGSFPPPVLIGPDGKTKYSWRVAILPYLDQASLYQQYDFGQEWDSPKNRSVLEQMPATFRSLSASPETQETSFVALVAPGAIFNDSGKGTPFAEIHDGTSNTLLIAACQLAVPWTKPEDFHIDMEYPPKLEAHDGMTFPALFADGSVKRLSRHLPQAVVRALITARGNEVIPLSPTQNK